MIYDLSKQNGYIDHQHHISTIIHYIIRLIRYQVYWNCLYRQNTTIAGTRVVIRGLKTFYGLQNISCREIQEKIPTKSTSKTR